MNQGILYGVGVGPGDPELMTVKACRILRECDVVALPAKDRAGCISYRIAAAGVPELAEKEAVCIAIPMTTKRSVLQEAYETGADLLRLRLKEDKKIAFLNLGDPTVYGSYMEFHEILSREGFCCEIVSGVPSFCASAASLGQPLASRQESLHIFPGAYIKSSVGESKDRAGNGLKEKLLRCLYENGQAVLMKSAKELPEVKEILLQLEAEGVAEISTVMDCGMEKERRCRGAESIPEDAGYFTTILVKGKREASDGTISL